MTEIKNWTPRHKSQVTFRWTVFRQSGMHERVYATSLEHDRGALVFWQDFPAERASAISIIYPPGAWTGLRLDGPLRDDE